MRRLWTVLAALATLNLTNYNVDIRTFPNNLTAMMFGNKEEANFMVVNENKISTTPKVDFNPPQASAK